MISLGRLIKRDRTPRHPPRRPETMTHEAGRTAVEAELVRLGRPELLSGLDDLPEHFVTARPAASVAAHLVLAAEPLASGQVWSRVRQGKTPDTMELLIVARDRPGLLATMAGVLALRGASVLSADATTRDDGLALDAFTLAPADPAAPISWGGIAADLAEALVGSWPIAERLAEQPVGTRPSTPLSVGADNTVSSRYTTIEVRGADRLGLLYHVACALYELGLDVHQAEIETNAGGVVDRFLVRTASDGEKLSDEGAGDVARALEAGLASGDAAGTGN